MDSLTEGVDSIKKKLIALEEKVRESKHAERIHKDNIFNRRFSSVLATYSDFETIVKRLEENIKLAESLNRSIYETDKKESGLKISEEGQRLRRDSDKINKYNLVDFKAAYIFAKIFLDEYTTLLKFLFDWRGIGDKSITSFYNALNKFDEPNETIIAFKKACLNRLRAVDVFITNYRDQFIVHDQSRHKGTRAFLIEMQGDIRLLGTRPSITPRELVYVVNGYLSDSVDFIRNQTKFI